MIPLKIHQPLSHSFISKANPIHIPLSQPQIFSLSLSSISHGPIFSFQLKPFSFSNLTPLNSISLSLPTCNLLRVSNIGAPICSNEDEDTNISSEFEDLSPNGSVYQKTLELVECSMFAALTGLVYFLSTSLAIENYFSCFFSLPTVVSSMRWGVAAGRKTLVATSMLLFVLSGPVKALNFLLKHGLVGFALGALWRSGASWTLSIFLCTIVRSLGAVGFVLLTSFLIRENILALITINIHASLTLVFTASGLNTVPSMNLIYVIFGTLVVLNSGCFMFLLHLLYSVFLSRLGMKSSLKLPRWLERAI
ncbi:Membrane protein [Quillaja saponaria]|uniref:Membrane protein n=1 Tax=Quillaja saponaria TaxID=32244 RepID=A0AAD7LB00_QUISA|nr:Membrane protein [Quillaja saponaria]